MLKTTFNISRMDCPSEEQMIRMQLAGLTDVQSLQFDLPGHRLEACHAGSYDSILAALNSLKLDTQFVSSEEMDARDLNDSNRQEKEAHMQASMIFTSMDGM